VASEAILDQAWWAIMTGLWSDPYLMNFLDTRNPATGTSNPDNTRLEGIRGGMRRHVWGAIGLNNERPVAELQYEATVCYRSRFLPVIPDDLLRIHQETVPLASDGTVPPADEVQRIISEYEFTPE